MEEERLRSPPWGPRVFAGTWVRGRDSNAPLREAIPAQARPAFCDATQPSSRTTLDGQTTGYPVIASDTTWDLFDRNQASGDYKYVRGGFNNLVGFGDMDIGVAWAPLNQAKSAARSSPPVTC